MIERLMRRNLRILVCIRVYLFLCAEVHYRQLHYTKTSIDIKFITISLGLTKHRRFSNELPGFLSTVVIHNSYRKPDNVLKPYQFATRIVGSLLSVKPGHDVLTSCFPIGRSQLPVILFLALLLPFVPLLALFFTQMI